MGEQLAVGVSGLPFLPKGVWIISCVGIIAGPVSLLSYPECGHGDSSTSFGIVEHHNFTHISHTVTPQYNKETLSFLSFTSCAYRYFAQILYCTLFLEIQAQSAELQCIQQKQKLSGV